MSFEMSKLKGKRNPANPSTRKGGGSVPPAGYKSGKVAATPKKNK